MSTKSSVIKLIVEAGKAAPTPPVGPALGSKGIKAMDFCKDFNNKTSHYKQGIPIPVLITVKPDRTFNFELKSPPTGFLLLKALKLEKGASKANLSTKEGNVGKLSLKHVYAIAKIKQTDERHKNISMENIVKSVIGVAKSMGIEIVS